MNKAKSLGLVAVSSIAIATGTIATWEGLETRPYKDVGGVLTVCYGETENVENREYSEQECKYILAKRVPDYYRSAMVNIPFEVEKDVPVTMRAAITSFTYNVGPKAFERSTMLKKIKRRDFWGACDELDRWVYVARMYVRGLANRREAEKRLCIAELPPRKV